MKDYYGETIFVNDHVAYIFSYGNKPMVVAGRVIEVWDRGCIILNDDDRFCADDRNPIFIRHGVAGYSHES